VQSLAAKGAQQWHIPIVSADWLEQSVLRGFVLPVNEFLLAPLSAEGTVVGDPLLMSQIPPSQGLPCRVLEDVCLYATNKVEVCLSLTHSLHMYACEHVKQRLYLLIRLQENRKEIVQLAEKLGAKFAHAYNSAVTHILHCTYSVLVPVRVSSR
jgi:hypothetical protein